MIYIRADANKNIAISRIKRCSAIAEVFHDIGRDVCFIVSDKCGNVRRRENDAKVVMMTGEFPKDAAYKQVFLLDILKYIEDGGVLQLLFYKSRF